MDPHDNDSTDSTAEAPSLHALFTPARLPCGRTLRNRLVKAAMYEHMAPLRGGPPGAAHAALYGAWARGGWGMLLTGNVQVASDHLTLGRDAVVPRALDAASILPFCKLARAMRGDGDVDGQGKGGSGGEGGALVVMQLSHAGRQSANVLGGRAPFAPPAAPSAVRLALDARAGALGGLLARALFQTPRAMTQDDIDEVVSAFVRGAELAVRSGFDGVEVHAGHGYLVAEFISPESNIRQDAYAAHTDPLRLLREIVAGIRGAAPPEFIVGVKLNAADYAQRGAAADETRVLQHVRAIARWRTVDFVEVSGGTYASPDFTAHGSAREALFARFAQRALHALAHDDAAHARPGARPLVLLTGGLAAPAQMAAALARGHADLLGVGRLAVLCPHLPRLLRDPARCADALARWAAFLAPGAKPWDAVQRTQRAALSARVSGLLAAALHALWRALPRALKPRLPRLVGAGAEMAWYTVAMRSAHAPEPARVYPASGVGAVLRMWVWVAPGPWPTVWWVWAACVGIVAWVVLGWR